LKLTDQPSEGVYPKGVVILKNLVEYV